MILFTEATRRSSFVSSVGACFLLAFLSAASARAEDSPGSVDESAEREPTPQNDQAAGAAQGASAASEREAPQASTEPAPASPGVPAPYVIEAPPDAPDPDQAGLDAARLSPPPAPHSAEYEATAPYAAPPRGPSEDRDDHAEPDQDKSPMGWLSVTLKVGYGHINSGSLTNPTYDPSVADQLQQAARLANSANGTLTPEQLAMLPPEIARRIPSGISAQELSDLVNQVTQGTQSGACTPLMPKCRTPERGGVQIGVTLHVGGDGFGWDAEPYISAASNAFAIGVYTGPKFDIHLTRSLYLGFGLGGKVAYVMADGWKYGADIYGRIPAHLTYYVLPNLALEVEGAFGAGVSGYATEPKNYIVASAPEFKFGSARTWDLTFGVRFP